MPVCVGYCSSISEFRSFNPPAYRVCSFWENCENQESEVAILEKSGNRQENCEFLFKVSEFSGKEKKKFEK